jgi:hypothetical protein
MSEKNKAHQNNIKKIGMLAGSGQFPISFATGARKHGVKIVAIGIKGEASRELEGHVDEMHWTGLARLGKWISIFKEAGIKQIVMCGGVDKSHMYSNILGFLPDLRTTRLWFSGDTREDHTLLEKVADEFEKEGITVESSILFCPELLAPEGCLTSRKPTEKQWEDICFGWPIAKKIAEMQIGQSIVVKDKAVIAVEGIDGTDATLRRGGKLGKGNVVAIKLAKENHDPRFDIPCTGPRTVDVLTESGVSVLALEANNTIVLDRKTTAAKAEKAGISIIAVSSKTVSEKKQP